jgi:hypothetical protein
LLRISGTEVNLVIPKNPPEKWWWRIECMASQLFFCGLWTKIVLPRNRRCDPSFLVDVTATGCCWVRCVISSFGTSLIVIVGSIITSDKGNRHSVISGIAQQFYITS